MNLVAPLDSRATLPCACGRTFLQHNALTNHQRTCPRTRKRLAAALSAAQEQFEAKKRRRLEARASVSASQFGVELRSPSTRAEFEQDQPDIEVEQGPETPVPEDDTVRYT
jgi:hypothetical protein